MSVLTWLRGLRSALTTANRRARRSTPHRRPPLRLETLEDRVVPSGGVPDPTFGTNGVVTLANPGSATAVQQDGKILVVGGTTLTNTIWGPVDQVSVTRLNADGSVDSSFGSGGMVKLPVAAFASGNVVAIQPDGKILVGASAYMKFGSSPSDSEYAVARLNTNGSLDTTFGNNQGWWLYNPSSQNEGVVKLEVVPNGAGFSIFVGGNAATSDGSTGFAAIKLTAAGLPDATFGTAGVAIEHVGTAANTTNGLAVTPSGDVILSSTGDLVAFTPTGRLDTSFNGTGVLVATGFSNHAMAAQGNDILVAETSGTGQAMVARYTATGVLDSSFATNGIYSAPGGTTTHESVTWDMKLEADGSIVFLGEDILRQVPGGLGQLGSLMGYLSPDGIPDAGFGTDGTGLVIAAQIPNLPLPQTLALDQAGNLITSTLSYYPPPTVGYVLQRFTGPSTAPTDSFSVTGFPSATTAGSPGAITVTALNPDGSADTGYSGTVQITSSDPHAVLPGTVTITNGVGIFNVTLATAGTQSITATDTTTGSITGGESGITVTPAAASTFSVSGFPSPTRVGVVGSFTVTAFDPNGNLATGYTGTVHFSSSDGLAALPAAYTFSAADNGVHTFSATLNTVGTQSLTATDSATGSIAGAQTGITVNPASLPAVSLGVTGFPTSTTAGVAGTITVTAKDVNGHVATGYVGTIRFTSNDLYAGLPANYTFTAADQGVHTFNVTLVTAGVRSITATDTTTGSILGSESGITVTPAAASQFLLSAPSSAKHGTAFSVTLTVEDAYGNVVTGYVGTVHFTSSDSTATLPANYTFKAADAGKHTFTNGVTLKKTGTKTITVTDTKNSALTTTDSINVT